MKNSLEADVLRAFLDEITKCFPKNQLLCREQFYDIAKWVRRS